MNALKPASVPEKAGKQSGLTLIELITVVIIFGIVATMAAPSFARLIAENRATANANQFLGALIFARSEAIKRNSNVTLVREDSWQGGWDINQGNTLIRSHAALSGPVTLSCENSCSSVVFSGAGRGDDEHTFTLCDASGVGREIKVLLSGQSFATDNEAVCAG